MSGIEHLSRRQANQIVSAAKVTKTLCNSWSFILYRYHIPNSCSHSFIASCHIAFRDHLVPSTSFRSEQAHLVKRPERSCVLVSSPKAPIVSVGTANNDLWLVPKEAELQGVGEH